MAAQMHYSALQIALLTFLLQKPVERTLRDIEMTVYRAVGRRRPKSSRQSTAGLIRGTSAKIKYFKAEITRLSDLGRGNIATYKLTGDIKAVRKSVSEAIDILKAAG
jgi:hypothetical protein